MYVTSLGLLAWFCLLVKLGGFTSSVPHVMRSCLIGPVWLCSISSMMHSARQISSQTGVNSPHLSNAALQGKALAEKLPDALAHVVMHDATGHKNTATKFDLFAPTLLYTLLLLLYAVVLR